MAPEIKYTKLFINNEWVDSVSGKTFETLNPQDASVNANVSEGDKEDVEIAVAAAKKAFHRHSEWRLLDASARGRLLFKLADLMDRDQAYLSQLETLDNGMIARMGDMFIGGAANTFRYFAGLADKVQGSTIPADGEVLSMTLKEPVGVCALILPWNVPVMMFANKVGPALAAGCTVIVKPAEQTPLTALALAALVKEAGFPPGVVNVINGYGPTAGAALSHHKDVSKVTFTGSCEVGKLIQQAAGTNNLKRVSLELGGKSPLVIFDDVDLDKAVLLAAEMVYLHQGQVCIAPSRTYVQAGIYEEFVKRAAAYAKNRTLGNSFDLSTDQGPQVDQEMFDKVLGYIEVGKQEGARLMTGGSRHGDVGYFIQPTVFADVTDDMRIAREEIFGPVQNILKFDTLEEVIDRANDTDFGLAAGVLSNNIETALTFAKGVQAGNVWINTYAHLGPQIPFGGYKDSGVGRELGLVGIEAYTESKTVTIALPK